MTPAPTNDNPTPTTSRSIRAIQCCHGMWRNRSRRAASSHASPEAGERACAAQNDTTHSETAASPSTCSTATPRGTPQPRRSRREPSPSPASRGRRPQPRRLQPLVEVRRLRLRARPPKEGLRQEIRGDRLDPGPSDAVEERRREPGRETEQLVAVVDLTTGEPPDRTKEREGVVLDRPGQRRRREVGKDGAHEQEASGLRAAGSPRPSALGPLRSRRGEDRQVHALLVVRRRDRDVSPRGGSGADGRPAGTRATSLRTPARDGLSGGATRRRRRCAPTRTPVRRAGVRRLPAVVKARLSTDGGARGNPGPAAYGYVLETDDGHVLAAHGERIGTATNNVAEYRALVAGLEKALELGADELEVVSDSELLVKQMRGEYKVKNQALRELRDEAEALARRLREINYTAVRREHNELADRLVNEALDALEA